MYFLEEYHLINPFVPNAPFLNNLKISKNLKVFWFYQGVKKGCIRNEWVKVKGVFVKETNYVNS